MNRNDSRTQRFAKIWLGAFATLVGIGSTVELAAMPIPAAEVQLPGPTLIQQSPEPQQPAGTPRPPSADESKPDSFSQLQEALEAARERLDELSKAADAVAATKQLQQELATLREENQKLRTDLEATRADRSDLAKANQAAETHAAELTKTVEQATAKARETKQELAAVRSESEQRIAAADKARAEAEARLSETRDDLQRTEQENARLGPNLTKVEGALASAKEQITAAQQEHAQMEQRAAALENERDDLRARLADASARLGWSEAVKAQLEDEVAGLRKAAGTAADDARQNLIAVQNRIKELSDALAAIAPASGASDTDAALSAESEAPSAGAQAAGAARTTAAAPVEQITPAAAPSRNAPSGNPETGSADADLQTTEPASATSPAEIESAHLDQRAVLGGVPAVLTLADLPPGKREHVQGLLAELHSTLDEWGLMTTVPGEILFAWNSDEVEVGAYGALAKIAELIRMYEDRRVLIIGHSDAIGDAAHNRQLSERRAERVKQIFVDYFELPPDRLSTAGMGDARPIASNATPEGRRANRRVEVLILN